MNDSDSGVPSGLPPGSVRLGGPVDRCEVTLRVNGPRLEPDEITALLGVQPTSSRSRSTPYPSGQPSRFASWWYTFPAPNEDETDPNVLIRLLLEILPSDPAVWEAVAPNEPDVFCMVVLEAANRDFTLAPDTMRLLVARGLSLSFDIYAER